MRAPWYVTKKEIEKFILENTDWINRKQTENKPKTYKFIPNEDFPYLGNHYKLQIGIFQEPFTFKDTFLLSTDYQDYANQLFTSWYQKKARQNFTERLDYYSRIMATNFKKIRLNGAKTQWGSCNTKQTITLNWRLILGNQDIIDYVIVHELSHLFHLNHSSKFWQKVESVLPNYKTPRLWLKKNGKQLHFN